MLVVTCLAIAVPIGAGILAMKSASSSLGASTNMSISGSANVPPPPGFFNRVPFWTRVNISEPVLNLMEAPGAVPTALKLSVTKIISRKKGGAFGLWNLAATTLKFAGRFAGQALRIVVHAVVLFAIHSRLLLEILASFSTMWYIHGLQVCVRVCGLIRGQCVIISFVLAFMLKLTTAPHHVTHLCKSPCK